MQTLDIEEGKLFVQVGDAKYLLAIGALEELQEYEKVYQGLIEEGSLTIERGVSEGLQRELEEIESKDTDKGENGLQRKPEDILTGWVESDENGENEEKKKNTLDNDGSIKTSDIGESNEEELWADEEAGDINDLGYEEVEEDALWLSEEETEDDVGYEEVDGEEYGIGQEAELWADDEVDDTNDIGFDLGYEEVD